jgi:glycosyltransferase domain-containing protein
MTKYAIKKNSFKAHDITLVMPTRNRASFVCAHLTFLLKFNFSGHIVVIDGGSASSVTAIKSHFDTLNSSFRLTLLNVPRGIEETIWSNINRCIEVGGRCIDTTYASLCFDDDFVLPEFLRSAIDVLESDKEVGFVVGEQIHLELRSINNRSIFWLLKGAIEPGVRQIDGLCAMSRIENFFTKPFQLAYAVVHRTTFLNYISDAGREEYFFAVLASDISWNSAALSAGKGIHLQSAHILRLFHGENTRTYGQTTGQIFQAFMDGRAGADARLLLQRLFSLCDQSKMLTTDKEFNTLTQSTILLIMSIPFKEFFYMRQRSARKKLGFLKSLPYRIYWKIYNIKILASNLNSIRKLNACLRSEEL